MYFKVNNVILNPLHGYNITPQIISDAASGRNIIDAYMNRKVIGFKWTIDMNFSFINGSLLAKILKACNLEGNVNLEFRNTLTDQQDTQEFYATPEITHKTTINGIFYYDLKLKFVQN